MPNVARTPASYSTAIQQRITSGNHFDGTLPSGNSPLDASNALYKYSAAAAGGMFFWNVLEPIVVSQLHVDLGGSGNVTVSIANLDPTTINNASPTVLSGESMTIETATAVTFIALDEARFKTILLPYQAILLVTTASGAAQIAQCVASLERTYVR